MPTRVTQTPTWDACGEANHVYRRFESSVSTMARVAAADAIGELLWNNPDPVTACDFEAARILFETGEGLGSRVARRYDVHHAVPAGSCGDGTVAAAAPDYCVGPAILQPWLTEAFAAGMRGEQPTVNAAKIRAAILWFLYVSTLKEAQTCAEVRKDCDSAWGYYGGGGTRDTPAGLGAVIRDAMPDVHDKIYDGILAIRCWREQDSAEVAVTLPSLHRQARDQLDRALSHAMAQIIRGHLQNRLCAGDTHCHAHQAALDLFIPRMAAQMSIGDPDSAAALLEALPRTTASQTTTDAALNALEVAFPCP